jgi:hypothetical protein
VANGERRKTRIFRLEQDERVIEGEEQIKSYITKFYKNTFEVQKLADYHLMSLWWRIFLKSPIRKVRC